MELPWLSYLIDSHAWNYICKNILELDEKAGKNIKNPADWGNYYNNKAIKYEDLDVLYAVHEYDNGWTKYADGTKTGEGSKYHKGIIPEGTAPKGSGNNKLELSTGASKNFKAYNIYDMAGNMWEWTTETGHTSADNSIHAVLRGGWFNSSGGSVVLANGNIPQGGCEVAFGFRVVLYL